MIQRATGPIHDGSSTESGFEPGTLRPQGRDLTTSHRGPSDHLALTQCDLCKRRSLQLYANRVLERQPTLRRMFIQDFIQIFNSGNKTIYLVSFI
ncbi:hypothetical protein AVEN_185437-1 [Araneus ventricosus]|uniref:Uncharacterized protein n=1 Tax=Araneus ventricosus TaxID=182803 RepID=A0A4Y2IR92_ARAVE|nr:hypothetical protein AVEN_185437-1 [Araneus ventricosus]